ncbi:hypothetical protein LCGC14_2399760 [marine sediment metagenome]|uniref:Uncharacterized protein n=1 Tax=marine sediment metagenome TaxID=412755 RepID=A0A0F9CHS5_9ZZZZ
MQKRHAARPRLVVDNSSRIAGLRAQKVLGHRNVFGFGNGRHMRAPAPWDAVFPLVYPLSVELLARPLLQFRSNDGASAQSVDEVSVNFHRPGIIGKVFRFVKAIIIPTTFRQDSGENRGMGYKESPDYKDQCGERLAIAREVVGYPIRADFVRATFAWQDEAQFKRDEDKVKTWENGVLPPPEFIDYLKGLFGITPNYIYSDDSASMGGPLSIEIRNLENSRAAKIA